MKKNTNGGFTLLEIMIVVATIGLLAAISVPAMAHAREKSQTANCLYNLREIDAARDQWAFYQADGSVPVPADLVPTFLSSVPNCPGGGNYTVGAMGTPSSCNVPTHVVP
jgi:prepilin-type N-terminal cleavage/methylation domain-containing protein